MRRIAICLLLVIYVSVSQFATKAFLTTDAGSGDDFCVTKNLEKHHKQYDCRETKQKVAWSYDTNTDNRSQTRDTIDRQLAKHQIIALLETQHSQIVPSGPDPPPRISSYASIFVGVVKLTI